MISYTAPDWVKDAVFYQIFPDRFARGEPANDPSGLVSWGSAPTRENFLGGNLQGILDHLPYLEDLGVTALYLTPIFRARSNHKYDTNDYLSVDPAFGTNGLLRKLVDVCHSRGIRVILDAVFNHCGDGFWAFEDVMSKGALSKYTRWFYPTSFPICKDPPNYQTCGEVGYLPKLNVSNPEVRDYLLKVSTYWLHECGIDGWRLDVPWKISLDFWRIFRDVVKRIKPDAYIVAEIWREPSPWLEGDTCDGIMNYPLRDYILDYCVRATMDAEDFDYVNSRLLDMYGPSAPFHLNLLDSHDTPRLLTLCDNDVDRMVLAIATMFTTTGTPMIFYGDEIGLTGENDPDCRRCMIWDDREWNTRILNVYRLLIRARHEHPALRSGTFEKLWVFNGIYAYRRYWDQDEVIVIVNPREKRQDVKVPLPRGTVSSKQWRDLFTGKVFTYNEGHLLIENMLSKTALVLFSVGETDTREA